MWLGWLDSELADSAGGIDGTAGADSVGSVDGADGGLCDSAAESGGLAQPLGSGIDEVASWTDGQDDRAGHTGCLPEDGPEPGWGGGEYEPLAFDTITAIDQDGDGLLETMIVAEGDQITVSYDLDGDGYTDYETVFDGSGRAHSWQDRLDDDGTWHWRRVE